MNTPRTDGARRRIHAASTMTLLNIAKRGGVLDLREAIHLRLSAHPRAQNLDPLSRTAPRRPIDAEPTEEDRTAELTPVERAASDHRAADDLLLLDEALGHQAHAETIFTQLNQRYPRAAAPPPPDRRMCPPGLCRDHWRAGVFDMPADGHDLQGGRIPGQRARYRDRCRLCGEWFAAYTQARPAAVIKAHDLRGASGITEQLLRKHAPYALEKEPAT